MTLIEIILELVYGLFAFAFAYFQVPVIKAMVDYVPVNNPYKNSFHRRGFFLAFLVMVLLWLILSLCLLVVFVEHKLTFGGYVFRIASFPLLSGGIYWIVFDCTISYYVHGKLSYIGDTAKIDKWLNKHLGEYAGIVKPVVVGVVVLIVNFYL